MSTIIGNKLNHLLTAAPKGIVLLSSWLKTTAYSPDLIKRYRHSKWLESIGVGARSAFSMLGKSHYLELDTKKIILFSSNKKKRGII